MRQIVGDIEKAAGHVLAAQGLKTVYEATDMPEAEDDMVSFVTANGLKSVVHIQVSSLHPSLDNANIGIDLLKKREFDDGWSYVEYEGVCHVSSFAPKAETLEQIVKALEENAGLFDLSEGNNPQIITHPNLGKALDTIDAFTDETGTILAIRPFKRGDKEGLDLVAEDGRSVRIEATPGVLGVIAGGERRVINTRNNDDMANLLKVTLEEAFPQSGMRP